MSACAAASSLLFLRRADFPRRRIAAGERGLRLLDRGAPAFVDSKQLVRLARQSTPRQSAVEFFLMLTNPLDIVHANPLRT